MSALETPWTWQGLGYALVKRRGAFTGISKGNGFIVARLPASGDCAASWSAPSFFTGNFTAKGYTCGEAATPVSHQSVVESNCGLACTSTHGSAVTDNAEAQPDVTLRYEWTEGGYWTEGG